MVPNSMTEIRGGGGEERKSIRARREQRFDDIDSGGQVVAVAV